MPLREEAQKKLLAESRKYPAIKILRKIPCLGPIRSAQIVAVVGTPHRFRTRRQYWPYCGLAVVTRSTSDYEILNGRIRRKKRIANTRGLNPDYSRILKRVYKSAALQATTEFTVQKFFTNIVDNQKGVTQEKKKLSLNKRTVNHQ